MAPLYMRRVRDSHPICNSACLATGGSYTLGLCLRRFSNLPGFKRPNAGRFGVSTLQCASAERIIMGKHWLTAQLWITFFCAYIFTRGSRYKSPFLGAFYFHDSIFGSGAHQRPYLSRSARYAGRSSIHSRSAMPSSAPGRQIYSRVTISRAL